MINKEEKKMAKTSVFFVVFFIGSVCGLAAQSSSSDFRVNQQQTTHLGNYPTWDRFVAATNTLVAEQRQVLQQSGISANVRVIWVEGLTRMENELVNRAYRELPETTRVGSAYLVQMMPNDLYTGRMIYNVYIYSDPDGKRYYRLLRLQW
jgi:hypothetical protein